MSSDLGTTVLKPAEIIRDRLAARDEAKGFEGRVQTAYAIIGALDQGGRQIVRKRHMRNPK